jgi:hypothetical protein
MHARDKDRVGFRPDLMKDISEEILLTLPIDTKKESNTLAIKT